MKRILILSASSGAGHIRAGQAIERALHDRDEPVEVSHLDALDYTNAAFKTVYSKAYIKMVNSLPGVLGLLYNYADEPWKDEQRRLIIDRLNAWPLIKKINQEKPDVVVATHFLPSELISYLICKKRIDTRLHVVVTDMDIHSMWLCRHYSRYFVARPETREHMRMLGLDVERISVTGIPVDPVFRAKKDKREMRLKYGLDPELPTIYMSSGGFGVGKSEEILANLSHMRNDAQVLALCGRNKQLESRLGRLHNELPAHSKLKIIPVPYTTKVDEYMAASDMVLGKPGGLTTSEALCRELVFVIVNPIPGQEERNSDYLLEQGAAVRCNNLPALAFKVDSLLDDCQRFAAMRSNVIRLAKPEAASAIAESIVSCDGAKGGSREGGKDHDCERRVVRRVRSILRRPLPGPGQQRYLRVV